MKQKFIDYYMDVAERTSKLSHAIRLQVGAVVVKDNRILSYGYNGMPTGWDNECEYKEYMNAAKAGFMPQEDIVTKFPFEEYDISVGANRRYRLVTKDEVLHAEMNCLSKVAQGTESSNGSLLFTTHAPCIHCAKAIFQAGISEVYYKNRYRSDDGLNFLEKCGVKLTELIEGDKSLTDLTIR
jgi:dCMP deaminase